MMLLRILRFPLTRLVIASGALGGAWFGVQSLLLATGAIPEIGDATASPHLSSIATLVAFLLVYLTYVRLVEWRPVRELSIKGAPLELGAGAFAGAGLFALTIVSIWAAGCYEVTGVNRALAAAPALSLALASGFAEEILVRGVIFRITEEGLGTWLAIVISALLFGLAHAANPQASVVSGLAVALEAGVLLAAAFILTRRLWLAIGLHFAWNFVQGGVFGVAVSGHPIDGLLKGRLSGPPILSGGPFGAEASVFAVTYCLAAGVFLLVKAHGMGRFVAAPWRRSSAARPAASITIDAR
jgi:membrane protease YdiL (CAAX protease family)